MTTLSNEILAKLEEVTGGDFYDSEYGFMYTVEETSDTLDDFVAASAKWQESNKVEFGEFAGFKFAYFGRVQVKKGDERDDLSVIDFGHIRMTVNVDLNMY